MVDSSEFLCLDRIVQAKQIQQDIGEFENFTGDFSVQSKHRATDRSKMYPSNAKTRNYLIAKGLVYEEFLDFRHDGSEYLGITLRSYNKSSETWDLLHIPHPKALIGLLSVFSGTFGNNEFHASDSSQEYHYWQKVDEYLVQITNTEDRSDVVWEMKYTKNLLDTTKHWENIYPDRFGYMGYFPGTWLVQVKMGDRHAEALSRIGYGMGGAVLIEYFEYKKQTRFTQGLDFLRIHMHHPKRKSRLLIIVNQNGIHILEQPYKESHYRLVHSNAFNTMTLEFQDPLFLMQSDKFYYNFVITPKRGKTKEIQYSYGKVGSRPDYIPVGW